MGYMGYTCIICVRVYIYMYVCIYIYTYGSIEYRYTTLYHEKSAALGRCRSAGLSAWPEALYNEMHRSCQGRYSLHSENDSSKPWVSTPIQVLSACMGLHTRKPVCGLVHPEQNSWKITRDSNCCCLKSSWGPIEPAYPLLNYLISLWKITTSSANHLSLPGKSRSTTTTWNPMTNHHKTSHSPLNHHEMGQIGDPQSSSISSIWEIGIFPFTKTMAMGVAPWLALEPNRPPVRSERETSPPSRPQSAGADESHAPGPSLPHPALASPKWRESVGWFDETCGLQVTELWKMFKWLDDVYGWMVI